MADSPITPLAKNSEEIFETLRGMTDAELVEEARLLEEVIDKCSERDFIWRSGIYDDLEERIGIIEEIRETL